MTAWLTSSPLALCARQELVLAVRSRWTQVFAVVFAGLALSVAASGYILSGGHGMQDFARTSVSLVQLVLLLVPLTSLLIGVQAFAPERGAAAHRLPQHVARGYLRHAPLARELARLGALAGAGRPEEEQAHPQVLRPKAVVGRVRDFFRKPS